MVARILFPTHLRAAASSAGQSGRFAEQDALAACTCALQRSCVVSTPSRNSLPQRWNASSAAIHGLISGSSAERKYGSGGRPCSFIHISRSVE